MKSFSKFTSALYIALTLTACSTNEPVDIDNSGAGDDISIVDTTPIATLQNTDGTSYTLHEDCIRLRNSDAKTIAEYEISWPDNVSQDSGYGQSTQFSFEPSEFYATDTKVIVLFTIDDNRYSSIYEGNDIAFVLPKNLTDLIQTEFAHGYRYLQPDYELDVLTTNGELFIYSPSFDLSRQIPIPNNFSYCSLYKDCNMAFGKAKGKYYLMAPKRYGSYKDGQSCIINLSDDTFNTVYLPQDYYEVRSLFFPGNYEHSPRFDSTDLTFENESFHLNYHFTLYSGDEVKVTYVYDLEGRQISPEPDEEQYGIFATNLSNITSLNLEAPSLSAETPSLLFYPNGGYMTVRAYHHIYGRDLDIEFDVEASDNSLLEISKNTSRSFSGSTSFRLYPKGKGNVYIIFTNPEIGELDRWLICIDEPNR